MAISASRQRGARAPFAKGAAWALVLSMPILLPAAARAQAAGLEALEGLLGEPVTDSVTGSPQRVSEAPADMEIVTADDIRRSGAHDIPGVLRHVAGVDVLQWDANQADVAIRGYNQSSSPRLLVLIDGRQVYENFYNHTDWRTLPVELDEIERIEIVKGPNSALYGFNAVNGVINIVTRDPLQTQTNAVSATGGTQSMRQGSAVISAKLGEAVGVRLAAGGGEDSDFQTQRSSLGPGPVSDSGHSEINLSSRIALPNKISLYLEGTHSTANYYAMIPSYTIAYVNPETSSIKARLSIDSNIGIVEASAYKNWLHMDVPTAGIDNHIDNNVTVAEIHDIAQLPGNNTVRASFEYRHNTADTIPLGGASVFYDIVSGAGMWDWKITPTVSLTNAIRLDHFSLGRSGLTPAGFGLANSAWNQRTTEVSYNSGLVWRFDEADVIRVMAARGVQIPSLYNLGAVQFPAPAGFSAGLPTTSLTVVDSYEVRWDRTIPGSAVHIQAAIFHNNSSPAVADSGGAIPSANIFNAPTSVGRSEATGLDLSLSGKFRTDWRWGLSYTPQIIADHFNAALPVAVSLLDYQHTLPTQVVNANLGWTHGPWEADGYARFESAFQGIVGNPIPGGPAQLAPIPAYASIDARIAYRLDQHFTVALSGQDLGQARQIQTSGPPVERRVLVTLSAAY
jgi:iron complex outermembrane receptor protein